MNIIFMGTPEFARHSLEYLHKNTRHEILAVVTGPDKPSGRGRVLSATAVKKAALGYNLPILTPESIRDREFLEKIKEFDADIYVVVAFRILPEKLYTIPPHGSINLHGSLLPKYRGAAPINWAIINGETETGLTTFKLQKKVDTGNIIYQEKIKIDPDETFTELYGRMAELAGPVLSRTLDMIESGNYTPKRQDDSQATPAPKITPYDCMIDWGFPAKNVVNFIRGMSAIPGAYTYFRGKKLKILKASEYDGNTGKKPRPGKIIGDKHRFLVATAGSIVEIKELIPEGKGKIDGNQFLRGYKPDENEILGERPEKDSPKK